MGPLAAQAVRRSGQPWPSPGERFPFVVAQGPPGSRLADVAVPPGEVTGGRPMLPERGGEANRSPMYLDIEYYLERQIGAALNRLFMLVRGPQGVQGQIDARRWIAEGPRPRRRDVAATMAAGGSHSASSVLSSLAAAAQGGACEACGRPAASRPPGGRAARLCSTCREGGAVPHLLEAFAQQRRWEARLQRCRDLCLHCAGSADAAEDCRNIYCSTFFRKVGAQLQLRASSCPRDWPAALEDW
eukprot:TRINITY_DN43540_c0_g1_i1.p1 TRINITY_DN43540_c0_g1~~TRINITY_DN43540_c0_g1_i1.p1  ORF type:complete len:262 (+),score=35.83 TRINITY_DN43540_c0_g1_i1:55-786(+)